MKLAPCMEHYWPRSCIGLACQRVEFDSRVWDRVRVMSRVWVRGPNSFAKSSQTLELWVSNSSSRSGLELESLGSRSSSGSSMSSNLQLVGRVRVPTFNSNSNINFLNRLALLIQEQPSLLGYVIYGFELKIWTHGSSSSSRSGLELDLLTRYIGQCLTIAKFIERWILFIYTDSSVHLLLSIHLCLYYLKHLSFYKAHK